LTGTRPHASRRASRYRDAPWRRQGGETITTARILIVEDAHLIAQGLARRVTTLGYTVVGLAASGEEAIAQAAGLQPDVVLMDIGLRGAMDGIEATRHIQAQAAIPVIYVSASMDAPTVARAWQTAPAGYLVKPVLDHELHATLVRAEGVNQPQAVACAHAGPDRRPNGVQTEAVGA
jgi:two-component system, response regulator PdtaR